MSQLIYITYVEREPPFLKIWGQIDKSVPMSTEKSLQSMAPTFDSGQFMLNTVEVGTVCCAKFKDNLYYRCIIINSSFMMQGLVEVLYIDYGNRELAKIHNLRSLECLTVLKSILPQAKNFILAGFMLPNTCDEANNNLIFNLISETLRYSNFEFKVLAQAGRYQIITLIRDGMDFTPFLVARGYGNSIDLNKQYAGLQNPQPFQMPPPMVVPPPPGYAPVVTQMPCPSTPTLVSYKTRPLEVGSEHAVYVSYVNDGPCLFSVQLKNMEDQLKQLMMQINSLALMNLEDSPLPGTICLARSLGDNYICRAVVTNMVDGNFKVFYVDFGNTEVLQFSKLFQIPLKYILPTVMSTRFSLYGLNNCTLSREMKCAFKTFVDDKALFMKVMPPNSGSALAQCELTDNQQSALEFVKKFAMESYPEPVGINRGSSHEVIISFVYSCSRFYARLKSKAEELNILMSELGSYCSKSKALDLASAKPGIPCNALFLDDGMFYRAKLMQLDNTEAKIFYVDFGNEEIVNNCNLRTTTPKFVTMLRPQAIQCCLTGYQNMSNDTERDGILEELILEQEFTMKVVETLSDKVLVDLIDANGVNVASSLLEKVATKKGLMSPRGEDKKNKYGNKGESPRNTRNEISSWREPDVNGQLDDSPSRKNTSWNERGPSSPFKGSRNTEWKDQKPEYKRPESRGHRDNDQSGTKDFNKNSDNSWGNKQDNTQSEYDNKRGDNRKEWDNKRGGNRREWDNKRDDNRQESSFDNKKSHDNEWSNKRGDSNTWSNKQSDESWGKKRDDSSGYKSGNRDDNKRGDRGDSWGNKADNSWGNKPDRDNSWGNKLERDNSRGGKPDREGSWGKQPDRDNFHGSKHDRDNSWGNKRSDGNFSRGNRDNSGEGWGRDNNSQDDGNRSSFQKRSEYKGKGSSYGKNTKDESNSNKRSNFKKPNRYSSFNNNKNVNNQNKRRDGSEKSWTGSDKGGNYKTQNTWTESTENYEYAETAEVYKSQDIIGKTEKVEVTYFYDPANFYVQLQNNKDEFCTMMKEIQKEYRNANPFIDAPFNCPVIAKFPEDKCLYRAIVLTNESGNYNLRYIDFGNTCKTRDVYKIQKKHMNLPKLAYNCSLPDIAPSAENWAAHSSFSKYFQRDELECTFISTSEDLYCADLCFNGKQVKAELIEANLALDMSAPIFDMNILWGQQLRCLIASVNNPSDLMVEIPGGLVLPAQIHDFEKATKVLEENFEPLDGQFVIIYVNYIENERLDLDLYDLEGNKIQVIEPDEGLPTVNPVCPLTVFSYNMDGYVSHVSEASIFIQPTYNCDSIAGLLEDMFNICEELQIVELTPSIGAIYAVLSSDTNWYRGQVVSVTDDSVNVYYIDYGNTEDVNVNNLRNLPEKYLEISMLCLEIVVENAQLYLEKEVSLTLNFGDAGWMGIINEKAEDIIPLPAIEVAEKMSLPLATKKIKENVVYEDNVASDEYVASDENVAMEETVVTEEEPQIFPGFSVCLSHFDTPGQFYLQTTESFDAIELLQSRLQEECEALANIENVSIGALCAAKYSVDEQWYRARVLDCDSDITTIRFIDYGNTDVLDAKESVIKTLPQDLLLIDEYAKRCSLYVTPNNNEWSAEACDKFTEITTHKELTAEIIHQDEKTTYVELYDASIAISSIMLNDGLVSEPVYHTKGFTGYVSNLNSPSEFWIQLENSCNDLEWVAEQLVSATSFAELKDMEPGTLCAAIFPDDDNWYRARILSNTVAGLEVVFIDYGNSCTSPSLRALPEELALVAPLASKCSLQKPNGLLEWPAAATKRFEEIAADGATIFTIDKISHGETSVVQLLLDNLDIALNLVPEVSDAYITHSISVNEFYIIKSLEELNEYNKHLDECAASLVDDENPDGVVAGLDGDKWRRCRKEDDHVVFIDSGKTGESKTFKKLSQEDIELEPFAIQCRLEPPPGFKWSEESNTKFVDICQTVAPPVQVENVGNSVVRLYIKFEDVRLKLSLIKCSPINSTFSSPKKCLVDPNSGLAAEEAIQNLLKSVEIESKQNSSEACAIEVINTIINYVSDNFSETSDVKSVDDIINYNNECDIELDDDPNMEEVIEKIQELNTNDYIKHFLTESVEKALNQKYS